MCADCTRATQCARNGFPDEQPKDRAAEEAFIDLRTSARVWHPEGDPRLNQPMIAKERGERLEAISSLDGDSWEEPVTNYARAAAPFPCATVPSRLEEWPQPHPDFYEYTDGNRMRATIDARASGGRLGTAQLLILDPVSDHHVSLIVSTRPGISHTAAEMVLHAALALKLVWYT